MNTYHITEIKWTTSNYDFEEEEYSDDRSDLPEQLIVQTTAQWSDDLQDVLFETLFDEYGWEPRSVVQEELEDTGLLQELDIIQL